MDPFLIGSAILRGANLILWILVATRILRHDKPVSRFVRRLLTVVILAGMSVLFIGGLVPFGIPGEWARLMYTSYTAFAGLLALGIITVDDE